LPARAHNLAVGSASALDFIDPADGWLMDTAADAPAGSRYRSRDSETSWHVVANLPNTPLPQLGAVRFAPDNATSWLGDGLRARPVPHARSRANLAPRNVADPAAAAQP
jgi:hypothetical protein